jgi:hypothetical protein
VDNASSNDSGVDYLRTKLQKTNIAQGKYLHMKCAAHIVNLIVKDGLQEVDLSVKHVRAAVRYIKNGTSRLIKFKEIVEEEKVGNKAFLKLDVPTRPQKKSPTRKLILPAVRSTGTITLTFFS